MVRIDQEALDALEQQLASLPGLGSPKGIVLDLRDNGGGVLDKSIRTADLFLDGGVISTVEGRNPSLNHKFLANPDQISPDGAIVVLVNGKTASGAEIVAAALQHHGRALVVGTETVGLGSVQALFPISHGGALKLMTALIYPADGEKLDGRGMLPDLLTESDGEQDLVALALKIIKAAPSRH